MDLNMSQISEIDEREYGILTLKKEANTQ